MGRRRGRPIDGVLALNKPAGMTSNAALQTVKALFYAARVGHTGSLDPAATGVLPLCFGRATRFAGFLLDADKRYLCRCEFGARTDTADAEGKIIAEGDAGAVDAERLERALEEFRGAILQTPPMYSAVKVNGQPLYRLARRGIEMPRAARPVRIHRLRLRSFHAGARARAELEVHCSKGAYIRALVDDIGQRLGCGAHVSALHRTQAGGFCEADTIGIETLEELKRREAYAEMDALLRPIERAVAHLPEVRLAAKEEPAEVENLRCGRPASAPASAADGLVRILLHNGEFVGVGELRDGGVLTPRRLAPA